MKRILLVLIIAVCGTSLSAQTNNTVGTKESVKGKVVANKDMQQENQIKASLLEDESLQNSVFSYLDRNKETNASLAKIYKSVDGNKMEVMKAVLGDKKLYRVVMDYVKDTPELLEKALSVTKK